MKLTYKIFFILSILLTIASIVVTIVVWRKTQGSFLSVDFRGGSVLEVAFAGERPASRELQTMLGSVEGIDHVTVTPSEDRNVIIQATKVTDAQRQVILGKLTSSYGTVEQLRFDDIGPTIGSELKRRSITAVLILLIVIIIYIAIVFRSMSRALSPWALGVAAIFALLHDIIVPVGVFSLLGYYAGVEVSAVFVAAALTILGYSVSDTVVVFDRVRENVIKFGTKERFPDLVHMSIMQTLTRSINTSMTTILTLLAIFFFGGATIKYFALALIIGIFSGTYSSIFIAAPIVVWWQGRKN